MEDLSCYHREMGGVRAATLVALTPFFREADLSESLSRCVAYWRVLILTTEEVMGTVLSRAQQSPGFIFLDAIERCVSIVPASADAWELTLKATWASCFSERSELACRLMRYEWQRMLLLQALGLIELSGATDSLSTAINDYNVALQKMECEILDGLKATGVTMKELVEYGRVVLMLYQKLMAPAFAPAPAASAVPVC